MQEAWNPNARSLSTLEVPRAQAALMQQVVSNTKLDPLSEAMGGCSSNFKAHRGLRSGRPIATRSPTAIASSPPAQLLLASTSASWTGSWPPQKSPKLSQSARWGSETCIRWWWLQHVSLYAPCPTSVPVRGAHDDGPRRSWHTSVPACMPRNGGAASIGATPCVQGLHAAKCMLQLQQAAMFRRPPFFSFFGRTSTLRTTCCYARSSWAQPTQGPSALIKHSSWSSCAHRRARAKSCCGSRRATCMRRWEGRSASRPSPWRQWAMTAPAPARLLPARGALRARLRARPSRWVGGAALRRAAEAVRWLLPAWRMCCIMQLACTADGAGTVRSQLPLCFAACKADACALQT